MIDLKEESHFKIYSHENSPHNNNFLMKNKRLSFKSNFFNIDHADSIDDA